MGKGIENRISLLLSEQHKKQKDLAEAMGVPIATLSGWLSEKEEKKERSIPAKYIPAACKFFNVDENWLLTGENSETLGYNKIDASEVISNVRTPYSKMLSVPLLSKYDAVCCGDGFSYEDIQHDTEGMVIIPEEDLNGYPTGPNPIYAVYADGDSMEPNIEDRERYVINPNLEIGEGEIAFLRWKGRDLMRAILDGKDGGKILRSTKPELYKDIIVTMEDIELEYLHIMGKVMFKVPRIEKVRGLI